MAILEDLLNTAETSRNNIPFNAGWSSLVARQAHNLKVVGSNPTPATKYYQRLSLNRLSLFLCHLREIAAFIAALFIARLISWVPLAQTQTTL